MHSHFARVGIVTAGCNAAQRDYGKVVQHVLGVANGQRRWRLSDDNSFKEVHVLEQIEQENAIHVQLFSSIHLPDRVDVDRTSNDVS